MLRPYSCQLLVGAKHLEDKLSVIAKNSSPNASPVQLLVFNYQIYELNYHIFRFRIKISLSSFGFSTFGRH
ncbi:hypothetical protein [Dolichospermum sp. UHCC 0315A]|uniref:hypothetical protein n=1 Tax=Dolichospermum sp. UHCC 0315A TaxID=1914871 RepID=UPI00143D8BB4|nr:hypothetical protein [Dolichospermum sp. UHCC 0315A]